MSFSIDESSDFGARAAAHLRDDPVVWLTTVGASGTPAPNPVWFIWDGADAVTLFSQPDKAKLTHITANSRVSLNFAGDGEGGDIVVLTGDAAITPDAGPATGIPEYVEKYHELIPGIGMTPESFAASYSVPVVVRLAKVRGF